MKAKRTLFITVVILVCASLLGCDNFLSEQELTQDPSENRLTREEELALLWDETFIKTEEELRLGARDFLNSLEDPNYSQLVISGVEPFSKKYEPGFGAQKGNQEASEIRFYLFILKNPEKPEQSPGYALACEDIGVGNVLAVVEKGDYNDPETPFLNVFKSNLDGHIRESIVIFNALTEEKVNAARTKLAQIRQNATQRQNAVSRAVFYDVYDWGSVPPVSQLQHNEKGQQYELISTAWGQAGDQYNAAIVYAMNPPNNSTGYKVGHDVTALAQLVALKGKANDKGINKPDAEMFSLYGRGSIPYANRLYGFYNYAYGNTYRNFSVMDYNWADMTDTPNASNLAEAYRAQVAALFLQVGCKMHKVFTPDGANMTPIEYVWNALYTMGYSAYGIQNFNGSGWALFENYFGIRRSIMEKKPVYASAANEYGEYTAWLISNYKIEVVSSRHTLVYLHCNLGNDHGNNNGWFYGMAGFMSDDYGYYHPYEYNLRFITGVWWRE